MISTTAEQALAFTNAIPEWLCKKRQQKLFCGEPLFCHTELIKEKKLHVFPFLYSSDILTHRIYPLLDMLQPKLVLFPEDFRSFCSSQGSSAFSLLFYSVNSKLRVPSLQNDFEGSLNTDLAFELQPKRLISKEMAIARLSGKLMLNKGKYLLVPPRKPINLRGMRLLLWGSVDPARLVVALKEKGIYCSIERSEDDSVSKGDAHSVRIKISEEALIETSATKTVICTGNATMAAQINEALLSICDGI